jgi:hypothetical protein
MILKKQKMKKPCIILPKHNVTTDSLGKMVRKYDKSSKRTLINDEVRVYKGFLEIERIG